MGQNEERLLDLLDLTEWDGGIQVVFNNVIHVILILLIILLP